MIEAAYGKFVFLVLGLMIRKDVTHFPNGYMINLYNSTRTRAGSNILNGLNVAHCTAHVFQNLCNLLIYYGQ